MCVRFPIIFFVPSAYSTEESGAQEKQNENKYIKLIEANGKENSPSNAGKCTRIRNDTWMKKETLICDIETIMPYQTYDHVDYELLRNILYIDS